MGDTITHSIVTSRRKQIHRDVRLPVIGNEEHCDTISENINISKFLFRIISDSTFTHQVRSKHVYTHALNITVITIIIRITVDVRQK